MALNHFLSMRRSRRLARRRSIARRLGRLGPTWRAAPLRRLVQAVCLVAFLAFFFVVGWPYGKTTGETAVASLDGSPLEGFLWIDPLVGISTALAGRGWNVAATGAVVVLLVGLVVPRGFCGYLCPLGTLIDMTDWAVTGRLRRGGVALRSGQRLKAMKYAVLTIVLAAACCGVLISGYVAAMAVVTRGMLLVFSPWQVTWGKHAAMARPTGPAELISIGLFLGIFLLGLVGKRFWCRYVCPSGAVFSLCHRLRRTERKVEQSCVACGRCIEICPFDAIWPDYTTISADCTWCQTCGGVCPTEAIQFVPRRRSGDWLQATKTEATPGASRRGFLAAMAAGVAVGLGWRWLGRGEALAGPPLRPPGSVAEDDFRRLCIRCGACLQVCPGPVLAVAGWQRGVDDLWTPVAVPTRAGCHPDCNRCTQVCPTGAIRPLTLEQKRRTRMGLAVVDRDTCLAHTGEQDCRLCADECEAAGYNAISMETIHLEMPDVPEGMFSEAELAAMSSIDAPMVDVERCVGCGLCEYRCHEALVRQQGLLQRSAVVTTAAMPGPPAT